MTALEQRLIEADKLLDAIDALKTIEKDIRRALGNAHDLIADCCESQEADALEELQNGLEELFGDTIGTAISGLENEYDEIAPPESPASYYGVPAQI